MQRRHFEAIAQAIRETRAQNPGNAAYEAACENMVGNLVSAIRRFNPQFDASRFREACALDTTYRNKSDGRRSA